MIQLPRSYEVYRLVPQGGKNGWFEASTAGRITSEPPVSVAPNRTQLEELWRGAHCDKDPRSSFVHSYARLG